ncbi:MAG: GNAT family N-acetyltransferase [Candidatus Marsarchaeota archaeon]|nr:GNAT family N-acetyltransferase [Candidatus Marsarchaeota archaeon]
MMQNLKVRIANNSDIKTITKYYHKLYKGNENQEFYKSKIILMRFRSGQFILVADVDRSILGYIWVIWYEHIKHKGIGYIEELYVHEKYRKMHIGVRLINEAKKLLRARDINTIYFAVGRHMTESQNFYETIGARKSDEIWFEMDI